MNGQGGSRTSPYSISKILHHPDLLVDLRAKRVPASPRVVHFMPELSCPAACSFCSYGHRKPEDGPEERGWKNHELMDETKRLSWEQAARFLDDFEAMGGLAIELTGGGEPLVWPHVDRFFERMARSPVELAIVTMGTPLTPERAEAFGRARWKWARVSIDAGTRETYCAVRRVKPAQWDLAWRAVELLARERDRGADPERRVGAGFVVDRGNFGEVYEFCRHARDAGADNVRVSVAFTPQHLARFPGGALEEAGRQAREAVRTLSHPPRFEVVDLVSERVGNLASPRQDYPYCAVKDVLCVVGGDANVYTCCSLAFNRRGLVGSIEPDGFRALWERRMPGFSAAHDPRRDCPVECLYERRNREAIRILGLGLDQVDVERGRSEVPPHVNFL